MPVIVPVRVREQRAIRTVPVIPVSATRIESPAPGLLGLVKKAQLGLSQRGLEGERAKVALCLDHNGSMRTL